MKREYEKKGQPGFAGLERQLDALRIAENDDREAYPGRQTPGRGRCR